MPVDAPGPRSLGTAVIRRVAPATVRRRARGATRLPTRILPAASSHAASVSRKRQVAVPGRGHSCKVAATRPPTSRVGLLGTRPIRRFHPLYGRAPTGTSVVGDDRRHQRGVWRRLRELGRCRRRRQGWPRRWDRLRHRVDLWGLGRRGDRVQAGTSSVARRGKRCRFRASTKRVRVSGPSPTMTPSSTSTAVSSSKVLPSPSAAMGLPWR